MADPIKILNRLEQLSTRHAVFEPDQVLTHHQLNSVWEYLDDQARLTHVNLQGVGVVAGLHVALGSAGVTVGRGLGVTTDGDLLVLGSDTVYNRYRPYDSSAPAYAPFYPSAGTLFPMVELVAQGESDVLAQPLAGLPDLANKVVVMLAECYENDPDLCTGADCDNLGRDALHRARLLLMARGDAQAMTTALPALRTASDMAADLPRLVAQRPVLDAGLVSLAVLVQRYTAASAATLAAFQGAFTLLASVAQPLLGELFASDPTSTWFPALQARQAQLASRPTQSQTWYSFLKDLVETWNAMREALFGDDSVVCPNLAAFPKHLLLGDLAAARNHRTGLYPSPLASGTREHLAHGKFLLWKLHVLIQSFEWPVDTRLAITPSRGEATALEDRAIPWYYALRPQTPIHVGWSYRLSSRGSPSEGLARQNLGYRAAEWGADTTTQQPLTLQVAAHDFFRIEGHLGQPVSTVVNALQAEIRLRNLPLVVRAVLLHTSRGSIVVKPPVRYTDLHRFHYLLRKDVENELKRNSSFSLAFKNEVARAAGQQEIPATVGDAPVNQAATERHNAVIAAVDGSLAGVAGGSYTQYRQNTAWKLKYDEAATAAGNFKKTFGSLLRTDVSTAFDGLVNSGHKNWLDWLDVVIDKKEEREDDKLLFMNFVQLHPGLDHLGGAWRGGTLVLAYDVGGAVVADFALPYWAADVAESEPEEPSVPPRPGVLVDTGFKLVKPLTLMAQNIKDDLRPQLLQEVNVQRSYTEYFKDSIVQLGQSFGAILSDKRTVAADVVSFTDTGLGALNRRLQFASQEVQIWRDKAADPSVPKDAQKAVQAQLTAAEEALGQIVTDGAAYLVDNKADVAAGTEGARTVAALAQRVGLLATTKLREQVGKTIGDLESSARASGAKAQADALHTVLVVGGWAR